jgi:hypothetical protein
LAPRVRLCFADTFYQLRSMATLLDDTPNYVGLTDKGINKQSTSNLVDKPPACHLGRAEILGHAKVCGVPDLSYLRVRRVTRHSP